MATDRPGPSSAATSFTIRRGLDLLRTQLDDLINAEDEMVDDITELMDEMPTPRTRQAIQRMRTDLDSKRETFLTGISELIPEIQDKAVIMSKDKAARLQVTRASEAGSRKNKATIDDNLKKANRRLLELTLETEAIQPYAHKRDEDIGCPTFKLLVVGDYGTGKKTFLNRLLSGKFQKVYHPPINAEIRALDFYTKNGRVRFNCWVIDEQEESDNIIELYFKFSQCAIIMFDVTSIQSYENVPAWHHQLGRFREGIPIVICGNKVDVVKNRTVQGNQITFPRAMNLQYYDVSAFGNYNFQEPFLYLARQLTGYPNLEFKRPLLAPAEVEVDHAQLQLEAAARQPLPSDDDADDAFE